MEKDIERLVGLLNELVKLLADHAEPHWAEWIAKDIAWIQRGIGYGVLHFLSAFGGMGSLNDVVFDRHSDNAAFLEEATRFQDLKEEAYVLASGLRHDAENGRTRSDHEGQPS